MIFISRGAEGPGREILQCPPSVCLSVRLSVFHVFFAFHAISNIKKKKNPGGGGGCGFFFLEKQFFLISCFMLFSTLKNKILKKYPFTYWLNGRWFLQIVERDSWNLYPFYFTTAPEVSRR